MCPLDLETAVPRSPFLEQGIARRLREGFGGNQALNNSLGLPPVDLAASPQHGAPAWGSPARPRPLSSKARSNLKSCKACATAPASARAATTGASGRGLDAGCISPTFAACAVDLEKPRLLDTADQKQAELAQYMWHQFQHQVYDLKDCLERVQRDVAMLQEAADLRKAWQEETAEPQLRALREDLSSSDSGWREAERRLADELRQLPPLWREELQASVQSLDEQLQPELRLLRERDDAIMVTCAKLQDGIDAMGANRVELQRTIAVVAQEDRARFSAHDHEMARQLTELDAHFKEELARLSTEYYGHSREQGALLQDSLERFDAALRRDMAELAVEQRSKLLEQQGKESALPTLADMDAKVQAHHVRTCEERNRMHEELRGDFQTRIGTVNASLETMTATFHMELGQVSKERSHEVDQVKREVQELHKWAAEAGKETATLKRWLAEVLAVPLVSKSVG